MSPETVTTTKDESGKVIIENVTISPVPASSAEIATDAKGQAKLTVKVYDESPEEALALALALYKSGCESLQSWAELSSKVKGEL